jgi:hypothetical protein
MGPARLLLLDPRRRTRGRRQVHDGDLGDRLSPQLAPAPPDLHPTTTKEGAEDEIRS